MLNGIARHDLRRRLLRSAGPHRRDDLAGWHAIAYLAPWKNRLNVWVQPVGSDEQARCVTADDTRTVLYYEWTDNPRWMLYLQDNGGDENWHVGEFARKMHDDLIDAVNWAVQHGYADLERVAIFGGSHGGYAALVGVTFTPDVFAAAIDYVGISSLVNFMRTLPATARPHLANNWHLFVGNPDHPEQEADMLTEVEYMVKHDEGHGFLNPENQIDMYRAVERFLAEHLGGRTEQKVRRRMSRML
jgi:S-formylglutathione hydrolase FrmB